MRFVPCLSVATLFWCAASSFAQYSVSPYYSTTSHHRVLPHASAPTVIVEDGGACHGPGCDSACFGPSCAMPCAPVCAPERPTPHKCPIRFYASGEYLLWWVKDGPIAAPVLVSHNQAVAAADTVVPPGASTFFGNSGIGYGPSSGIRATVGAFVSHKGCVGGELSGFYFPENRTQFVTATSNGSPLIAVPVVLNGVLQSIPLSYQDFGGTPFNGGFAATSQIRYWSGEANLVWGMIHRPCFTLETLFGFRYLNLDEELQLTFVEGQPASTTVTDRFQTRNIYYGAQLGLRARGQCCFLSVEASAKFSLGNNDQVVETTGASVVNGVGQPFGLFATPGSIGSRSGNELGTVSDFNFKGYCHVTDRLRLFAGYNFLFWTNVVRPGDQINPNISSTVTIPAGTGVNLSNYMTSVGTAANNRASSLEQGNFWAHGLSLGLEFRY